jgi:hypothetical protein
MNRFEVSAERTARATPEAVWALVSDATRYPEWGRGDAAEYRRLPYWQPYLMSAWVAQKSKTRCHSNSELTASYS